MVCDNSTSIRVIDYEELEEPSPQYAEENSTYKTIEHIYLNCDQTWAGFSGATEALLQSDIIERRFLNGIHKKLDQIRLEPNRDKHAKELCLSFVKTLIIIENI